MYGYYQTTSKNTLTDFAKLQQFVCDLKKQNSPKMIASFYKLADEWCALDHDNVNYFDAGSLEKIKPELLAVAQEQSAKRKQLEQRLENDFGKNTFAKLKDVTATHNSGIGQSSTKTIGKNELEISLGLAKELDKKIDEYNALIESAVNAKAGSTDEEEKFREEILESLRVIRGHEKHIVSEGRNNYPSENDLSERERKEKSFALKLCDAKGFNESTIKQYLSDANKFGHAAMAEAMLDRALNRTEFEKTIAQDKTPSDSQMKVASATPAAEPEKGTGGGGLVGALVVAVKAIKDVVTRGAAGEKGEQGQPANPPKAEVVAEADAQQGLDANEVKDLKTQFELLVDGDDKTDKAAWEAISAKLKDKGIHVDVSLKEGEYVSTLASRDLVGVVNKLSADGITQEELAKIGDAMNTVDSRANSMGIIAANGQDVEAMQGFAAYDLTKPVGQHLAQK